MNPNDPWTAYLLALLAGLIYAGGAITGKKGLELGCGQVRTVILSNLILSVCFIPHLFLSPGWPTLNELVIGSGLGSIFLLAQALLFRALRAGDASMVSPLMGIKSILVHFSGFAWVLPRTNTLIHLVSRRSHRSSCGSNRMACQK